VSGVSGHLLEIVIFIAVVVADAYGLIPLTQTIILVPFVWIALLLRNVAWTTIGFSWPSHLARSVSIGIVAGILLELFATYVTTPQISEFFGVESDNSSLKTIQGNVTMLIAFLGLNWTVAAFGEEICFRGFLLKRLAQVFGESRAAWWLALTLSSLLFGWGHTEQGMSGWVQEGLSGFLLGVLFLVFGRNLTIPIIAHGVSNTLAFILIYFGRYPGLSGA
jgi:membrane protease YdiL (CAAX protease family)